MTKQLPLLLPLLLATTMAFAQNVGINQPTPQATLHVGGSTSTVRVDGLTGSGQRVLTAAPDGTFGTQAQPTLGVSGQTLTLTSGGSSSSVTLPTNTGPTGATVRPAPRAQPDPAGHPAGLGTAAPGRSPSRESPTLRCRSRTIIFSIPPSPLTPGQRCWCPAG
ncbi:hypothetical protein [Hymenobacter sp. BRD67]|uniref:hypothetical protein n=1 Tax=Hymenobacter sp. BRD67 TaxID=2675877 RepID=UPI0015671011|nr:hypothetical protein [Hymenobacter sp. BRD67]QKG52996.1 hypothetical protein GKZ67_10765 [Hymenobacter sp. BRD67]